MANLTRTSVRIIDDSANNPTGPTWAPEGETVIELIGVTERDQPEMLIVADICRDAIPPTLQQLHGDWVRWERITLKARVNHEDGAVWLLLQKKVKSTSMTRVVIRDRWLYFEEFVQNYPRAAQAMRPVSDRCFVAV